VERAVDDRLGGRLLAVEHHGIHELGDDEIAELGVRIDLALLCSMASGHLLRLSRSSAAAQKRRSRENPYFGRFAPYLERRCLRFFTPCVSSTPRMMW